MFDIKSEYRDVFAVNSKCLMTVFMILHVIMAHNETLSGVLVRENVIEEFLSHISH